MTRLERLNLHLLSKGYNSMVLDGDDGESVYVYDRGVKMHVEIDHTERGPELTLWHFSIYDLDKGEWVEDDTFDVADTYSSDQTLEGDFQILLGMFLSTIHEKHNMVS